MKAHLKIISIFSVLILLFISCSDEDDTKKIPDDFQYVKLERTAFFELQDQEIVDSLTSMLNVLYQAGLPILKILDIVKVTIDNVVLAREIESIKKDVADGKGVSGGILGSKLFPRLVGYMIAVGEKSGSLPMMLDALCDYFSLEVKNTMRSLTGLIEPIMTMVLGITVAFMALAIFLPMWNLIGAIKTAG